MTKTVKTRKTRKMTPPLKIMNMLVSGNVVTKDEIERRLGDEIHMYLISTYMWQIKTQAKGIIRVAKNGRRVISYQLVNVKDIEAFLKEKNALVSPLEIGKLSDLKAQKVSKAATEKLEVTEVVA